MDARVLVSILEIALLLNRLFAPSLKWKDQFLFRSMLQMILVIGQSICNPHPDDTTPVSDISTLSTDL